jgi:hypothetical protein
MWNGKAKNKRTKKDIAMQAKENQTMQRKERERKKVG